MYVTPERLRAIILDCQARGSMSADLAEVVRRIAAGLHSRFHLTIDVEDYSQEVILQVIQKMHLVNPDKIPFNYLTTIAFSVFLKLNRDRVHYEKKLRGLWDSIKNHYDSG